MDKPYTYGVDPTKKPRYQPVEDCTYWPILVSLNNWNTIQFTNKLTSNKDFNVVNKVVLDGTSDNMVSLLYIGKYGAINVVDPTKMVYYAIR